MAARTGLYAAPRLPDRITLYTVFRFVFWFQAPPGPGD